MKNFLKEWTLPAICGAMLALLLFARTTAEYTRGFEDGQGEAYSHIDDNVCKPGAK